MVLQIIIMMNKIINTISANAYSNATAVPLEIEANRSGGVGSSMRLIFQHSTTAVAQDLTTLVDTGTIILNVAYMTNFYDI
jgi:hypothetical protein